MGLVWERVKALADDKLNIAEIRISESKEDRKHCEKRRKCWLPTCSPLPTMFSKGFFFRFVKSGLCGKELILHYTFPTVNDPE